MMRRAILGLVAIGAVVGLLSILKRKAHKMRAHCKQMMAYSEARDKQVRMREHCERMAARHEEKTEQSGAPGERIAATSRDRDRECLSFGRASPAVSMHG
jgi:type II secretory pathway component PulJ